MNRLFLQAGALCLLLCSLATPKVFATSYDITGSNVDYPSKEQIAQFYHSSAKDSLAQSVEYQREPSFSGGYDEGELSMETQESALDVINYVRYIAGIGYQLSLNADNQTAIQAGAFANALEDNITHSPSQGDMSNTLYQLAVFGANSSNLAQSFSTLGSAITHGWMEDGDSANIQRIGHRRWVLNPTMEETVFGFASHKDDYSAMYAFQGALKESSTTGVAWPAQAMPTHLFDSIFPWSYTANHVSEGEEVFVTLTRLNDGEVWDFSMADDDKNGKYCNIALSSTSVIGQMYSTTIIFRPDPNDIQYTAGDVFYVEISGAVTASYGVEFFDVSNTSPSTGSLTPASTPESFVYGEESAPDLSLELSHSSLLLTAGESAQLTATSSGGGTLQWYSSNNAVATVSDTGLVKSVSAGTCTIAVITEDGSITRFCTLIVSDGGNSDEGNSDGGNSDGENSDDGNSDGGNSDGGNSDGGNSDDGNSDGDQERYPNTLTVLTSGTTSLGGTASFSQNSASQGTVVYINVQLYPGFQVESVTGRKADGSSLTIQYSNAEQSYYFLQPEGSVVVKVTLEAEVLPWTNPFYDVTLDHWFYPHVALMNQLGLMNGVEEGVFAPGNVANRAMIVTIFYNYDGKPGVTSTESAFFDVKPSDYFHIPAQWASENSVVGGMSEGVFAPDLSVTREQLATMIYAYEQYRNGTPYLESNSLGQFWDGASVSSWAETAVAWCAQEGIVSGRNDGTFCPKDTATRGEVSVMLSNYILSQM